MCNNEDKNEIKSKETIKTHIETFTRKVKVPKYIKPEIKPIQEERADDRQNEGS